MYVPTGITEEHFSLWDHIQTEFTLNYVKDAGL
jgi:hypothetical protein